MFKRTKLILIATLLLSGCSTTNNESNNETKSVPEEMEASKYVGQGFQPPAEKDAIEFAKKHKDKIAKRGEQFFMDNFGLKVKATNVVGSGDGVEVFVHCDDHDIVLACFFYVIITCVYSRSELYSPAEAIYLAVGLTGDIFLVITRYIYLDNIELLQSLHHSY